MDLTFLGAALIGGAALSNLVVPGRHGLKSALVITIGLMLMIGSKYGLFG